METMLPKPSYSNESEAADMSADLRSFIYLAGGLTHTMRYRASGEPEKPIESYELSGGDRSYIASAIMEYYFYIHSTEFTPEDRDLALAISLSYDLGDIARMGRSKNTIKTQQEQTDELGATLHLIADLPDAYNFRDTLWKNFLVYKTALHLPYSKLITEQELKISHLVRATKGLGQLMYITSKPRDVRNKIFTESSLTKEVIELKYGRFIAKFPELNAWYKTLLRLLKTEMPTDAVNITPYKPNELPSAQSHLLSEEPRNARLAFDLINFMSGKVGVQKHLQVLAHRENAKTNIRNEVYQLLFLLRCKRIFMFSHQQKSTNEHRDSVAEHSFFMMVLARYFLPIVKGDVRQQNIENLILTDIFAQELVHDLGEIVRGDKTPDKKTKEDSQAEYNDMRMLHSKFLPRKSRFHDFVLHTSEKYEADKSSENPIVCPATFVKCLDIIEAFLYIIDPETADKKAKMKLVNVDAFYEKNKKYFELYPTLNDYFKEIILLFKLSS